MIRLNSNSESEKHARWAELAINAEIMQHWRQAAILWQRLGELKCAEYCEEISEYLAVRGLDKLLPHKHRISPESWRKKYDCQ